LLVSIDELRNPCELLSCGAGTVKEAIQFGNDALLFWGRRERKR